MKGLLGVQHHDAVDAIASCEKLLVESMDTPHDETPIPMVASHIVPILVASTRRSM